MTHDTNHTGPPLVPAPPAARRGSRRRDARRRGPRRPVARPRGLRRWAAAAAAAIALGAATPLGVGGTAAADDLTFPFSTGFATADGGTLSGDAHIVNGRLRLTDAVFNAAGAWAMDDSFPSDRGLDIEFDYAMYTEDDQGADGLLLSLADGSVPPGVGAYGAALGYSCRAADTQGQSTCTLPGLPGAFAAVALDQYGNFSLPFNDSGPGRSPDTVTVRGSGDGTTGYRFVGNAVVDGGVATGSRTPRKVRIVLQPEDDGLTLTVRLSFPGAADRTVLDHVQLQGPGQAPLPDTLRLGFTAATGSFRSVHEIDALRVAQPADLRVEHDMPPVVAGDRVRYTVSASNVGGNASDPSPVTIDVPDQLRDVTWTCSVPGPSSCRDASGSGDVATAVGLARGATATFTVEGRLDPGATGQIASTATIDTAPGLSDTNPADNTSRAAAPVSTLAQVSTDKSVTPESVRPGDELEYTVTARNDGPSTARDVGAVDDLPTQVSFVGPGDSGDACTAAGQRVTCTDGGDLAPGQEHAFRFRARLDPEYSGDGSDVVNVATATSPTDPDGGAESPEVPIRVVDPDEPGGPGDPGDPDGPGDPGDPDGPGDPGDPGDPDGPGDPGDPDGPGDPGDPDGPGDPGDPGGPDGPGGPGGPEEPGDSGGPGDTDGPGGTSGPDATATPGAGDLPGTVSGPGGPGAPDPVGSGRGDAAPPRAGALAYTGVRGLPLLGVTGLLLAGTGVTLWMLRRRRAHDDEPGSTEERQCAEQLAEPGRCSGSGPCSEAGLCSDSGLCSEAGRCVGSGLFAELAQRPGPG